MLFLFLNYAQTDRSIKKLLFWKFLHTKESIVLIPVSSTHWSVSSFCVCFSSVLKNRDQGVPRAGCGVPPMAEAWAWGEMLVWLGTHLLQVPELRCVSAHRWVQVCVLAACWWGNNNGCREPRKDRGGSVTCSSGVYITNFIQISEAVSY